MLLAPVRAVSQSILSAVIIADPDDFIYPREKNLSVADLAGPGRPGNCLHDFLSHGVGDHQFELNLGNEIDGVFPATVKLRVPLLPSVAAGLEHGHALDSNLVQRILYAFEL